MISINQHQHSYTQQTHTQEEKENIRKYMEMVAEREAKAEEERRMKKAAADAAFKAVVEQTEKQNNEEDELRMLRWLSFCFVLLFFSEEVFGYCRENKKNKSEKRNGRNKEEKLFSEKRNETEMRQYTRWAWI